MKKRDKLNTRMEREGKLEPENTNPRRKRETTTGRGNREYDYRVMEGEQSQESKRNGRN